MSYELVNTKPPDRRALLSVAPDGRVLAAANIDLEAFGGSLPVQEIELELKVSTTKITCTTMYPSKVLVDIEFYGTRFRLRHENESLGQL